MLLSQPVSICVSVFAGLALSQRWEPWPSCWGCVSRASYESSAIGIELSDSYAAASIRYANGTVSDLVKVDASPLYIATIRDLDEGIAANSKTIEVLGELLTSLRKDVASLLDGSLPPAMVSMRRIKGLQAKQVRKAMLRASLKPIQDEWTMPTAVGSALAALDIGLCENYRYLPDCDVEEAHMPIRLALGVHFSTSTLTATLSPFSSSPNAMDFTQDIEHTLGQDAMPGTDDVDEEDYWGRLREAIQRLPRKTSRQITDILLMGNAALEKRFQEALRDALAGVLPPASTVGAISTHIDLPGVLEGHGGLLDLTFVVARGAAELGKRRMEQPDNCVERAYCKWWRGESSGLGLEL